MGNENIKIYKCYTKYQHGKRKYKKWTYVKLNTNMGSENKKMYKCYTKYQHGKRK
jgi:hypothetical protein